MSGRQRPLTQDAARTDATSRSVVVLEKDLAASVRTAFKEPAPFSAVPAILLVGLQIDARVAAGRIAIDAGARTVFARLQAATKVPATTAVLGVDPRIDALISAQSILARANAVIRIGVAPLVVRTLRVAVATWKATARIRIAVRETDALARVVVAVLGVEASLTVTNLIPGADHATGTAILRVGPRIDALVPAASQVGDTHTPLAITRLVAGAGHATGAAILQVDPGIDALLPTTS